MIIFDPIRGTIEIFERIRDPLIEAREHSIELSNQLDDIQDSEVTEIGYSYFPDLYDDDI